MARGGKRSGSGRPPGAVNKVTAETRQAAVESGQTPLEYMLSVMRDPSEFPERRDRMAIAAAPYLHAKVLAAAMVEQKEAVHYWHWSTRYLEHIRDNNNGILRGKPISSEMKAAIDALPPRKPDASGSPDLPATGGEQREVAIETSGSISPPGKRHWSE
jgi:hypothetical protein